MRTSGGAGEQVAALQLRDQDPDHQIVSSGISTRSRRGAPDVAAASELITSIGYVEAPRLDGQSEDGLPLRGVNPEGSAAATVTAGTLTALRGDTVALDVQHARSLGDVGLGEKVTLRLGDGAKADLTVVATS